MLIDLDGTLTDSTELIRRSFDHPLHVHLGRATDEREWLSDLGRPLVWQFTQDPREVEGMVATYRAWNLAHHDELAWLVEGTRSAAAGALEHTGSSECVASWSVGSAITGWGDQGERDATEHTRVLRITDPAQTRAGGPARACAGFEVLSATSVRRAGESA